MRYSSTDNTNPVVGCTNRPRTRESVMSRNGHQRGVVSVNMAENGSSRPCSPRLLTISSFDHCGETAWMRRKTWPRRQQRAFTPPLRPVTRSLVLGLLGKKMRPTPLFPSSPRHPQSATRGPEQRSWRPFASKCGLTPGFVRWRSHKPSAR